ncbi:MAG: TonB family protein [Bacteroidales bacterium]|nr:TonB family protein [Bacteroidales bacterium]
MKLRTVLSLIIFCAAGSLAAQNFNVAPQLRKHVEYLASDALLGRGAGTEGERLAASYIYDRLENAGLEMLTGRDGQDFTIKLDSGEICSANILGIVDGYDPKLRDEFIVVGAHLDAPGASEMKVNGSTVLRVCPGADGNATGVAALMEISKMVAQNAFLFPRSVIFIAFGAGEQGNAGAWYFVNRAFTRIGEVKAMVNLDQLGRGDGKNPFSLYSSFPGKELLRLMDRTAELPVVTPPKTPDGIFPQSDYLPFYEQGIPVFHFTTGLTREYHTPADIPSLVQYSNLERSCNYIYHFLQVLSREDFSAEEPATGHDPVYSPSDLDELPRFFRGDERKFLKEWVYKYLKYPASAISDGVSGKVMVGFVIEKDGSLSGIEVERGVDLRLDEEAIRVISVSPKWSPGKIKGSPVRTRLVLPVEFRLKATRKD